MCRVTARDYLTLGNGSHSAGEGLILKVRGNTRTWLYRYQLNKKRLAKSLIKASTKKKQPPAIAGAVTAFTFKTMKLEDFLVYPATISKDGKFYLVRFPGIKNAITQGTTYANAIEMGQDWLIEHFQNCADDGEIVEEAQPITEGHVAITVPVIVAFKVMIRNAMIHRGITQSALAEAHGMSRQSLSTLLSYRRLNSRMDSLVKIASSVGLTLTVYE